jgi:hypothetical protein
MSAKISLKKFTHGGLELDAGNGEFGGGRLRLRTFHFIK